MDFDEGVLARLLGAFAPKHLQLKFVVTDEGGAPSAGDLERLSALLLGLPTSVRRTPVFLIPEAYAPGDYSARCRALEAAAGGLCVGALAGFDLRVQPQWHRVLHGDQRGR
jgi:hypothetical protein